MSAPDTEGALSSSGDHESLRSAHRSSADSAPRQTLAGVDRRARIPFRAKLTLVAGLLVVAPLMVIGVMVLDEAYEIVAAQNRVFRAQLVENISQAVVNELRAAEEAIAAVGRVTTDASIPEEVTEDVVRDLVGAYEAIDHVAIYAANGHLVIVSAESGVEIPAAPDDISDELRQTAARDGVATGGVVVDPAGGAPRVWIVLPMRVGAAVSGYAASHVSLDRAQSLVSDLADYDVQEDGAMVLDAQHRIVLHLNPARGARLEEDPAIRELLSRQQFSTGLSHVVVAPFEMNGEPSQVSVRAISGRQLYVFVQFPESIAVAAITNIKEVLLGVVVTAVLIALIAAFVVSRQITKPIAQLSAFAEDLANRRFDKRVTLSTQDEFGVLGDVMSAAAADLQASEERIRQEEAIRGDLGRYLPAEIVDKVVKREQDMGLGGKRREITVLFADIVAFTPMTDQLSAEEIVSLLNELFTLLTEIVFRHGGIIDKFIGDCVMAVFGAPENLDDHAERAVAAAEDMLRFLEVGNEGWKKKHGISIELAIGINSGDAIVGNVGSEARMQYTAIGDTVNVAARLETIARPQQILVTKATRDQIDDDYEFVDLGEREMVGRAEPVHVFEVRI